MCRMPCFPPDLTASFFYGSDHCDLYHPWFQPFALCNAADPVQSVATNERTHAFAQLNTALQIGVRPVTGMASRLHAQLPFI